MSELVDMSPFFFSDGDVRRVFVGKKQTSLLLVELETGKLKATIDSECPWDPFEDLHDDDGDEIDLDETAMDLRGALEEFHGKKVQSSPNKVNMTYVAAEEEEEASDSAQAESAWH